MPAGQGGPRFNDLSRRWHDLADRRLAHFVELYHSGRWRFYYATEEQFAAHMLEVIRAARIWARLAGREPPTVTVPVAVMAPCPHRRFAHARGIVARRRNETDCVPPHEMVLHRRGRRAVAGGGHASGRRRGARSGQLKRGEELLQRDCARCHAVGRTGASPRQDAPAFRTLGQRYPIESLEESLAEGIMSGHPDMPEFAFDAEDVGAIIAYLKSIQQR